VKCIFSRAVNKPFLNEKLFGKALLIICFVKPKLTSFWGSINFVNGKLKWNFQAAISPLTIVSGIQEVGEVQWKLSSLCMTFLRTRIEFVLF
jgi:hypothetical protein